jgi:nitroreductase
MRDHGRNRTAWVLIETFLPRATYPGHEQCVRRIAGRYAGSAWNVRAHVGVAVAISGCAELRAGERCFMQRRTFLKTAGVVTVAVAGGGVWRAYDHGVFGVGEGPAYEPWKDWRNHPDEGTLALVRAAILAASPHNTQPWLFKVTSSSIELYIDTKRNVGALDPFLREEHIGIGCALENLMLAAPAHGYHATATLVRGKLGPIPAESKAELVAQVDLVSGKQEENELYEAIPKRHTNRSPYSPDQPIPPQFVDTLSRLSLQEQDVRFFLFTAEGDRKKIVEISSAANADLYSDSEVECASDRWIRANWGELQQLRDGLSIDAFGLPPSAAGVAKMMPLWLLKRVSRSETNGYSDLMLSAPLIGIIAVHDRYEREHCLRAGRIWQRAHLLATARGLAGRPCNESVEMIDHEKALGKPSLRASLLAEVLGDAAWQPTFVFYMGYPKRGAHASPRRSIESVIL